ncbi:MAG: cysteine synthase A [Rhizobiales bacterium]|nr:cysteine synthase A [Hyphomicrobiales bacterium]
MARAGPRAFFTGLRVLPHGSGLRGRRRATVPIRKERVPSHRETGRMAKFDSILGTVGHTPVVRINRLAPANVNLYVKVEAFNPLGSVKDRLALGVIEDAEKSGRLKPGQTVIEGTSGNTGIGLAMVCAAKGYPLVVTMAETFSVERRKLMRFLGAKVVLTPASQRGFGMVQKAAELAEKHGWYLTRQFENEANADMHSRTTAREIVDDFAGERLDYWVTGFGTGGTLKGVARVLAKERPDTKIVLCEPAEAPMVASGAAQERNADGTPAAPHPAFKPHPMQGWSPDFIPKLTGDAVASGNIARVLTIPNADALKYSRELAQKEGIFVGITAGGTFAGALQVAKDAPQGSTILAMLPDTGERYLSTPLFADVTADMTEEEQAISRSTPGCQMAPAAA